MEYNQKTVSLSKMVIGNQGFVEPICDNCKNFECPYNIEYKEVSIYGVVRTYRLLKRGNDYFYVLSCEGFIEDEQEEDIE